MKDRSTYDYALEIAESITNGQRKQAIAQFKNALADSVNAGALLNDVQNINSDIEQTIWLAGAIIDNQQ